MIPLPLIIFGAIVFGYASYEDIKYRAVTPLPLALFLLASWGHSMFFGHNYLWGYIILWTFAMMYMLSRMSSLVASDGLPILPEGDVWLMSAYLAGLYDWKGMVLGLLILAFAELGLVIGLLVRHGLKGLNMRVSYALPLTTSFLATWGVRLVLGV